MTIVTEGKNLVRDLICGDTDDNVNQGGLGTDATAPSVSDTGLNSNTNYGTSGTIKTLTYSTSDKQIIFDYNLPSTDGNGNTFKEFGISSSTANKLFNRQTFADLAKTSSIEFQISVAVSIK